MAKTRSQLILTLSFFIIFTIGYGSCFKLDDENHDRVKRSSGDGALPKEIRNAWDELIHRPCSEQKHCPLYDDKYPLDYCDKSNLELRLSDFSDKGILSSVEIPGLIGRCRFRPGVISIITAIVAIVVLFLLISCCCCTARNC